MLRVHKNPVGSWIQKQPEVFCLDMQLFDPNRSHVFHSRAVLFKLGIEESFSNGGQVEIQVILQKIQLLIKLKKVVIMSLNKSLSLRIQKTPASEKISRVTKRPDHYGVWVNSSIKTLLLLNMP